MTENVFGVTPEPAADQGAEPSPAPVSQPQDSQQEPPPQEPAPSEPAKPEPERDDDEDADEKELLSEDPENGFRIGSKVYKDLNSADRAFRQFAGRASAEARRRKEVEAELERTRSLLDLVSKQQPQKQDDQGSPATPAPPPPPKRLTDLVSDEEFDQLVAEHGPAKAFRRLAELTESRLAEALEESQRDIRPILQRTQAADRTAETFDSCAALKDEKGSPLFPEIGDPNSPEAQAVFAIWQRNFSDPALAPLAFTSQGVRIAVLEHRAVNGQPASSRPRTAPAAAVAARRTADRTLQSMGTSGGPSARPAPGHVGDDEERVQAALAAQRHPVFGVTTRAF
jgi:hypothetical protein